MVSKKYSPAIVCGFGAAVLTIVPGIRAAGCCLFVPLAASLSLFLYKKINKSSENISTNNALLFGLFTGLSAALFATLFDLIITYITRSNDFVESLPQVEIMLKNLKMGEAVIETLNIMKNMAADITNKGFSFFYSFILLISNTLVYTVFGIIGSLLGMYFINKKNVRQ
ncbi:MAG: hypothetical protein ABI550_04485 [Ignavibacteriaceae bacterium]